jgi:hypothetical protein
MISLIQAQVILEEVIKGVKVVDVVACQATANTAEVFFHTGSPRNMHSVLIETVTESETVSSMAFRQNDKETWGEKGFGLTSAREILSCNGKVKRFLQSYKELKEKCDDAGLKFTLTIEKVKESYAIKEFFDRDGKEVTFDSTKQSFVALSENKKK